MLKLVCNLIIVIWYSDLIYQIWCLQIYGDKPLIGMCKLYKLFFSASSQFGHRWHYSGGAIIFFLWNSEFWSMVFTHFFIWAALYKYKKSGTIISNQWMKKVQKPNLQYLRRIKHICTERRGWQKMHLYFLTYW